VNIRYEVFQMKCRCAKSAHPRFPLQTPNLYKYIFLIQKYMDRLFKWTRHTIKLFLNVHVPTVKIQLLQRFGGVTTWPEVNLFLEITTVPWTSE